MKFCLLFVALLVSCVGCKSLPDAGGSVGVIRATEISNGCPPVYVVEHAGKHYLVNQQGGICPVTVDQ